MDSGAATPLPERPEARLELRIDQFARTTLEEEAVKLGVSVAELARFAVLYYLADLDSGRIAREIPPLTSSPHDSP